MASEKGGILDESIPQWKKELILRRRAVGRVLPTGSGSVQLTCPSVVAAVRFAEYSVDSDFLRRCESEREPTGGCKNMRLGEQVTASDEFVEPCVILDIKEIITKIESGSSKELKMGEENNSKKINSPITCEKKSADDDINDNASDSSEEFKYGPGIVSKLKSKYLSLTLRESQGRSRPALDGFRRATSLENILDAPENEKIGEYKLNYLKNIQPTVNGNSPQRCRGLSRNNKESMKRARSVEVLTRYDRGNSTLYNKLEKKNSKEERDGIQERGRTRNRVSSSSVEETELPPPDLVKHTLKIFESSNNSKTPINLKNKNQKNGADSICAKKPTVSRKLPVVKQNSLEKANKLDPYNISANGFSSKNKISDKKVKNINYLTEKTDSKISGTVEKRKAALLKNTSESVIIKKSDSEHNGEVSEEKNSNIPLKEELSLDLPDKAINWQKASPLTSPKVSSERLSESPEPKRCISPVLVRAPPCILSTELNSSISPSHHVKQVGVIRPIVTNKSVHSNLSKPLSKGHLTEREIEKNLINKVKSIEQPVTKVIVSLKQSPEDCLVVNTEPSNDNDAVKKGQFWDKKPNTMVFNFSNRKTIPDYIENDGLILAPRKEKPKLEPGIIFLGGSTEDSSTDFDPDDFSLDPPSPCNIVFEGDNILINGKSNLQSKPKLRKMKIQFNDEATTTFEYPSEASLLDDFDGSVLEQEMPSTVNSPPGLPNPFRCGNLASYTPSKLPMSADFELGVTKTTPTQPPPTSKKTGQEEEEEDYLRPADESSTVSWSAETAADLLF